MQRKRLVKTLAGGFAAETVNKIVPFVVLPYVIRQLGKEAFGNLQFSYNLIDMAITIVVAGYAYTAAVELGQNREDPQRISAIISEVTVLKAVHAVIAALLLGGVIWLHSDYHKYAHVCLALSFIIGTSALDMSFVHVGTSRVLSLSLITIVAKITSLILIFVFVRSAADLVPCALLYFGVNGAVALANFFINVRRYPLHVPSRAALKRRFLLALPFALTVWLLMLLERYDGFFIERLYGEAGAGIYYGAGNVVRAIGSVATVIALVFFSEIVATKDRDSLTEHVQLGLWAMWSLLLPIVFGAWFVGDELLVSYLGPNYLGFGHVFALLLATLIFQTLISVFAMQVLMVHRRAGAINGALAGSAGFGILTCACLGPGLDMQGAALINLATRALAGVIFLCLAAPYLRRLPKKEVLSTILPAAGMAMVLTLVGRRGLWLDLSIGATAYVLLLALCNRSKLKLLATALKARTGR